MKRTRFLALAGALVLAGCVNSDYDMPRGMLNSVDKEITLFQDQITVPVGSVGPLTLNLVLDKIPLFNGLIKTDADGFLLAEDETEMYSINVYETMARTQDPTNPYTWDGGMLYGNPSGMALTLGYLGFTCPDQTLTVSAKNPLRTNEIALHGTIKASRYGEDAWTFEQSLEGATMAPAGADGANLQLAHVNIPGNTCISSIQVNELKMDLPGNPDRLLASSSQQNFVFTSFHRSHLAVGPAFTLSPELPLSSLSVPLGQFKLKKCVAKLDLESTLPLDVTISSVKVLKAVGEGAETQEDPNISVSVPIHVAAGSLEAPAVTPVMLQIEALSGTIPDINGLKIVVTVKGDEAHASTRLSAKQGIYVKSSSIKLVGGITLNSHE